MAYRYTDTNKWGDKWFSELKANSKFVFMYLTENCDIAGFYELSMKKLRHDLEPFTDEEIKQALKDISKSFVLSKDKSVLLLKNFAKHQKNTPLNHKNMSHKGIFSRIEQYKSKFTQNIVAVINNGEIPKQDKTALKGLQQGLDMGYGNVNFNIFYDLYNRKIGDKKKCEEKWNSLTPTIQRLIIQILPKWKEHFSGQILPYPLTWLNQARWEDDLGAPVVPFVPKKEEPKVTITSNRIDHRKRG